VSYRRLKTLLTNPELVRDFMSWSIRNALTSGHAVRTLYGTVKIGDFSNFSEFHMAAHFLEQAELRFLRAEAFGTGVFIDVGANLGVVSLLLAERLRDRQVYALEPNPTTFQALQKNIARNNAINIVAIQAAVSDIDGTISFDADPVRRGTASITTGQLSHTQDVRSITLDTLLRKERIDDVALLKVDVEGFETVVFKGARETLHSVRPKMILFEVCPKITRMRGYAPAGPAEALVSARYKLLRLGDNGQWRDASLAELSDVKYENWLAIPK